MKGYRTVQCWDGVRRMMSTVRPPRTILAHSIRLACANWHQADRVTPEWWARALEAR